MGFFIFQKYDTDVTFEKVMGQCHLSLTVAANDGEVLYRRKTIHFFRLYPTFNREVCGKFSTLHLIEDYV